MSSVRANEAPRWREFRLSGVIAAMIELNANMFSDIETNQLSLPAGLSEVGGHDEGGYGEREEDPADQPAQDPILGRDRRFQLSLLLG